MSYIDLISIIACAMTSFLLVIGAVAWIYVLLRVKTYANRAEALDKADYTEILKRAAAESGRAIGLAESAMESVSTLGAKITQRHKREDAAEKKRLTQMDYMGGGLGFPVPPDAAPGISRSDNTKRLVRVQR